MVAESDDVFKDYATKNTVVYAQTISTAMMTVYGLPRKVCRAVAFYPNLAGVIEQMEPPAEKAIAAAMKQK